MPASRMEHLRVVVQLVATAHHPSDDNNNNNIGEDGPKTSTVELIDSKTVRLSASKQIMSFDYVGHASEDCLESEMSRLMDELLLERRNCCLMRFAARRESHLTFLYNLLVTEVNQRLEQLNGSVHLIKVEYHDIVHEGALDMLHCVDKKPFPVSRLLRCSNSYTGSIRGNSSGGANDHFGSTRELLLWLLNEYRVKWSDTAGHEALVFHFFIVGARQQMFKVKFALFNVYLTKMDANDHSNWHQYMKRLGYGSHGANCNFAHTSLTGCLSDYFEIAGNGRTLLMFDVPTDIQRPSDTVDLLKMAHAVVKNRNLFGRLFRLVHPNKKRRSSNGETAAKVFTTSVDYDDDEMPLNVITSTPSSVSFTIPIASSNQETKKRRLSHDCYSKKDLYTLSTWYGRINDLFTTARDSMDQFYAHSFGNSIVLVCSNIKAQARHLDHENKTEDLQTADAKETRREKEEPTQDVGSKCKTSVDAFHQLSVQIENSSYAEILKIYMETKKFELTQHALNLKIKNLECYRQRVTTTINEELGGLNCMLFQENENDNFK